MSDGPVKIPYSLLLSPDETLPSLLQKAFSSSPSALGLLLVEMPPEYAALRSTALLMSNTFASLSDDTREKYADAESKWSFGWSLGKEMMNGKADTLKGSYYNNPTHDVGDGGATNIWPKAGECEGFEEAFKAICAIMVKTGRLVAKACDDFARLLHYFPPEDQRLSVSASAPPAQALKSEPDDSWCGVHCDHGLLTALCPALFLFHPLGVDGLEPLVIPSPSEEAGLYIKTRNGETVKGRIPENCLAFQTGETLTLLTSSRLAATPHFVSASVNQLSSAAQAAIAKKAEQDLRWKEVKEGRCSRETLAVFMQPDKAEVISPNGETFGDFTDRVLGRHY